MTERAMPPAGEVNGSAGALYELHTDAPVIGSVLPLAPRGIQPSPWPRPADLAADAVDAGRFRLAAASFVGLAHASAGTCRQDAHGFCIDASGTLYVVVADGLGSRAASHLGAALFCESVILAAAATIGPAPDPVELAAVASERLIHVAADAYGLSTTDIPCVALVGVLSCAGAWLARVGDTTAFLLRGDEFVEVFPNDSRYVNVVDAVVPGNVADAAEVVKVPIDAPLAMVTDGLATDIRTSPAVRGWLRSRWDSPVASYAMADSLRYRRQGSHDDRTAVVVWPAALDSATDHLER